MLPTHRFLKPGLAYNWALQENLVVSLSDAEHLMGFRTFGYRIDFFH